MLVGSTLAAAVCVLRIPVPQSVYRRRSSEAEANHRPRLLLYYSFDAFVTRAEASGETSCAAAWDGSPLDGLTAAPLRRG